MMTIVVSAAESVDLLQDDDAAYSGWVTGTWKYFNETTKCHSVSKQNMRAQFEYRKNVLSKTYSDVRVFVAPGEKAPYTESSVFTSDYKWRLALSPKNYSESLPVSGTGTIYL